MPQFPAEINDYETSRLRQGGMEKGKPTFLGNMKNIQPLGSLTSLRESNEDVFGSPTYDPSKYIEHFKTPLEANFS